MRDLFIAFPPYMHVTDRLLAMWTPAKIYAVIDRTGCWRTTRIAYWGLHWVLRLYFGLRLFVLYMSGGWRHFG